MRIITLRNVAVELVGFETSGIKNFRPKTSYPD